MPKKIAIFAFSGEPMCFAHALLNSKDLKARGYDVKLIIEGSACQQVKALSDPHAPFADLYQKVKDQGLIDCVCKACSSKMKTLEDARRQELHLCDEMSGHPSISRYIDQGYEVIVF